MRRTLRILVPLLILLAVGILALVLIRRAAVSAFEDRVERAVVTTLQRETPERFLITGRLDVTATVTVTSRRVFLPDLLDLELGSAEARVRAPGRVSYGFDLSGFDADDVRILDGGIVEISVPALRVYAVDPLLEELEIESRSGWLHPADAERRVTEEALGRLRQGLEAQATAHLEDSVQPRVNSARAIRGLLEPALQAAGVEEPRIRIVDGEGSPVEPRAGQIENEGYGF